MQSFGKAAVVSVCALEVYTITMGKFSCPALKSALLHRPATRDRAVQVAELLSKPKPERIAEGAVLDFFLKVGLMQYLCYWLNSRFTG